MLGTDPQRARAALAACSPSCPRDEWIRIAMAAKAAGLDFGDFDAWSAAGDGYDVRKTKAVWKSIKAGGVGPGSLFFVAKRYGWTHAAQLAQRPVMQRTRRDPDRDDVAEARRKRVLAARLWRESLPITPDCPAGQYLLGRHCVLPPVDGDLRWLPRRQLFGFDGPTLVGRISAVTDASHALGLHLTWLTRDGSGWKRTERRYLGRKGGGVVRLWPDEAVTLSLAVAEGIETALAGARMHQPVWACLDAGNLATFPVLTGVESLVVFVDNDANGTGQGAAADLGERWLDAGREVTAFMSSVVGRDIADEVTQ